MANDKNKDEKETVAPVVKYRYVSHTLVRFTHNKMEVALQYGTEYTNLPADSSIIQNLIDQKRLIIL